MNKQVTDGRFQAEYVYRYYYEVADKAQKRHIRISLIMTMAALIAGLLLFFELPRYMAAGAFFVVTFLSVLPFYWRNAENGAVANLTAIQYRHLVREWEELQHSGETSSETINVLRAKHDTIANVVDLPDDEEARKRANLAAGRYLKSIRATLPA